MGLLEDLSHLNYNHLSARYKEVITKEEFESATSDDLYEVYERLNAVEVNFDPRIEHLIKERGFKTPQTCGYFFMKVKDMKFYMKQK